MRLKKWHSKCNRLYWCKSHLISTAGTSLNPKYFVHCMLFSVFARLSWAAWEFRTPWPHKRARDLCVVVFVLICWCARQWVQHWLSFKNRLCWHTLNRTTRPSCHTHHTHTWCKKWNGHNTHIIPETLRASHVSHVSFVYKTFLLYNIKKFYCTI